MIKQEFDTRDAATQQRELTFGEKLCGVDFNPAGDEKVRRLKALFAEAADIVHEHNVDGPPMSHIGNHIAGGAVRNILDAQMWCVKHVTNRH